MRGLANMRVDAVLDPVTQRTVAIHLRMNFQEMERTIYLDGRAHPSPNAVHTFSGFSTGTWQDNVLSASTTHLKENYIRRNGIPASDKRTFTEHWVRHGDYLTIETVITDPVDPDRATGSEPDMAARPHPTNGAGHLRVRTRSAEGGRRRPRPSARHKSLPPRSRGLVRAAGGSHTWRRGHDVPGISKDDGQAGQPAAGKVRAVLRLRPRWSRVQSAIDAATRRSTQRPQSSQSHIYEKVFTLLLRSPWRPWWRSARSAR